MNALGESPLSLCMAGLSGFQVLAVPLYHPTRIARKRADHPMMLNHISLGVKAEYTYDPAGPRLTQNRRSN